MSQSYRLISSSSSSLFNNSLVPVSWLAPLNIFDRAHNNFTTKQQCFWQPEHQNPSSAFTEMDWNATIEPDKKLTNRWRFGKMPWTFVSSSLTALDRRSDEWEREDIEPRSSRQTIHRRPRLLLLLLMTVPQVAGLDGLRVCWEANQACMLVAHSFTHLQGPCGFLWGEVISPHRAGMAPRVALDSACPYGSWAFAGALQKVRTITPPWTRSMGSSGVCGCPCLVRFWDPWTSTWVFPTPLHRWEKNASCPQSLLPPGPGSRTPHILLRSALKTFTMLCQRSWCQSGSPSTWILSPHTFRISTRIVFI